MSSLLINVALAAAVAFTAHQMGASHLVSFLTFWTAFRVETALSSLLAIGQLNQLLVGAELEKTVAAERERLAAVERIARNN